MKTLVVPADGVDNDCDDRVDEEVSNSFDDDGDGLIDEDLATLPLQILSTSGSHTRLSCSGLDDPNTIGVPGVEIDDKCHPVQMHHVDVPSQSNTFCRRAITRRWNGSDACGNTNSSDEFIEILDKTAPKVDVVLLLDMNCNDVKAGARDGIAYYDDCGNDGINMTCSDTYLSNYTLDAFYGCVMKRRCVVQDRCGNQAPSVEQTIRLNPQSLPTFSAQFPDDLVLTCGASIDPNTTGRPVSNDYAICSSSALAAAEIQYTDTVLSSKRCRDVLTRQWSVRDVCGQGTNAMTQKISVIHNPTASVTFPSDTTVMCNHDISPDRTGWPTARRNCSNIVLVYSDAISGCVILRTWNATDICGSIVATAVQRITVSHGYNHVTFPDTLDLSCDEQAPEAYPVVKDKRCHGVVVQGPYVAYEVRGVTGDTCKRIVRRNVTVSSSCEVVHRYTQTIEYTDRKPPSLQYPSDVNVTCSDAVNLNISGRALANDTCTSVEISFVDGLTNDAIERTWSAMDDCGNEAYPHIQRVGLLDQLLVLSRVEDRSVYCNESTSPDHTGSPKLVRDVSDFCQSLGVNAAVVTYEDHVEGITCPRTIRRKWIAASALGHSETVQVIKQGGCMASSG